MPMVRYALIGRSYITLNLNLWPLLVMKLHRKPVLRLDGNQSQGRDTPSREEVVLVAKGERSSVPSGSRIVKTV
jgi:hypothetical protein